MSFYLKKFKESKNEIPCKNFVTNRKIKEEYLLDRLVPFINAPIELRIIYNERLNRF